MEKNIIGKYDIIFRPSSFPSDGAGHVFRSIALAQNFSWKEKILFLLDDDACFFKKKILENKFNYKKISKDKSAQYYCKICILDGYNFEKKEIMYWKKNSEYLVVVDDLFRSHNYADLIVNFGLESKIKKIEKVEVLSSLNYLIVEKKYFILSKMYKFNPKVSNLFLSFGFIDSKGILLKILKVLKKITKQIVNINVFVVVGSKCPHLKKIKDFLIGCDFQYELIIDSNSIENYLVKSDLAIGSGGVSLLERSILGVPSITIVTAKNQINQTKKLLNMNLTILKKVTDIDKKIFGSYLIDFINNFKLRNEIFVGCKKFSKEVSSKNLAKYIKQKSNEKIQQ